MEQEKYLGNAPIKGEPTRKLNFRIKKGSVTLDKLSDAVIAYIDSKGSGGTTPTDLIPVITAIVREQLVPINESIQTIMDELNSLDVRVNILEEAVFPEIQWYVGQCIDNYIEGSTDCARIFASMSTQELISNATALNLATQKQKMVTLTKPVFYALIPEETVLEYAKYGVAPFETVITDWDFVTHDSVNIEGIIYRVYATMNTAFVSNPTQGEFKIR